jgi:hypothetical protein
VTLAHYSANAADNPSMDVILSAVRRGLARTVA